MTKQEKKEANESIAKILGFKKHGITVNGFKDKDVDWYYPEEYRFLGMVSPMRNCPDFINIIQDYRKIKKIIKGYE